MDFLRSYTGGGQQSSPSPASISTQDATPESPRTNVPAGISSEKLVQPHLTLNMARGTVLLGPAERVWKYQIRSH